MLIEDSKNKNIPIIYERKRACFLFLTTEVFSVREYTTPFTPPEAWRSITKAPARRENAITSAFPLTWVIISVILLIKAANIFPLVNIIFPNIIPAKSETKVSLVIIVRTAATITGSTFKKPWSIIFPPRKLLLIQ